MKETRSAIGAAAALTLALVLYDAARTPADVFSGSSAAAWSRLGEAARIGLLVYGAASLVLFLVIRFVRAILQARRNSTAFSRSALPLYAGTGAAAFVVISAVCVLAERRGAPAAGSAPWLLDALLVVMGAAAAGWACDRAFDRCSRARSPIQAGALLAGVIVLPALVGCVRAAAAAGIPAAAPPRVAAREGLPDVVLLVADTLRPDALSCYGGSRFRTPAIDGLAVRGVRFTAATAQASWTNPSTATLLTGLMPAEHGMSGHRGRLAEGVRTLAESLGASGYDTAGIVANLLVSKAYGFDRGFRHWDEDPDPSAAARHPKALFSRLALALGRSRPEGATLPASEMVDRALRWMEGSAGSPRFLYLHLMDPHDPYTPPPDLGREIYADYKGRLVFERGTLYRILRGEIAVDEADLAHARALYDAEVAGMDREIARLVERLKPGLDEGRTVLVFTADHGEEFMEHGSLGHEHTLYQELINVPLIVVGRGRLPEGEVVSAPVRLMDVVPTILDLAGLPADPALKGRSLVALASGNVSGAATGDPIVFSDEDYLGYRTTSHRMRAARLGDSKVILYSPNVFGIGPWRREAFDLAADPGERQSRLPVPGGVSETLEAALRDRIAKETAGRSSARPLDPETEQKLRALGYVQ